MNTPSQTLGHIEQLTHDIINHQADPLFTVIDQGNGMKQVMPTHLANKIIGTVRQCLYPLLEQFPIHEFNPYINVFIKNVINNNLFESIEHHDALKKPNDLYVEDLDYRIFQDMATRIRFCVDQIRLDAQSFAFKNFIYNAHRASQKNLNGMMLYIDSLLDHNARLLSVRLDLGYSMGNIITTEAEILAKYREAKHDFKRLLNNAKANSLFRHLVGYVWTLEYGPEKGFHFHIILFFDGSHIRQDVSLGFMIGDYWKYSITNGRGLYHNCNANKDQYQHCGIGMIHYDDAEMRNNLKNAAAYLCKVDHYARMLTPGNGRNFGRGEILPPKTDNRGRPRSSGPTC